MDISYALNVILQVDSATVAPEATFGGLIFRILSMLALLYLVFYFLVIKPQQQRAQAQIKMLDELKRGDTVVTTAGIIGRISAVESDHVLLEVSSNAKIKFERDKVVKKLERKDKDETKAA